MDLQRFHNEYFVDTYSEDDPTLLELFPAENIHRRSVNLMNLDLDRRVTAVNRPSRPVDGDSRGGWLGVRCFQVRKRIRVDVPNKSTHLHFKFHIGFIQVHRYINAVDP